MANEKRLIDANAFLKSLDWECGDVCEQIGYGDFVDTEYGFSREAIGRLLQNSPTVDAVEVVHGRWEEADDGDGIVCSVCGTDFCVLLNETDNFNYCPNCGANMKGE